MKYSKVNKRDIGVTLTLWMTLTRIIHSLTHHNAATDFLPKTSWSLVGHSAHLPCEIEPENPSEVGLTEISISRFVIGHLSPVIVHSHWLKLEIP